MDRPDFGIFSEFWNGHPNHLPFLSLRGSNQPEAWNLNKSLELLDAICYQHSDDLVKEGIYKLLDDENWRPHLVAILASFKLPHKMQQDLINRFWERLYKGSWISPQILSVLSIIDRQFEDKAKAIIANGFKVSFSPMTMIEYHSARGPEGANAAAQKVIASMAYLLEHKNDNFGWKSRLTALIDNKRFKTNQQ